MGERDAAGAEPGEEFVGVGPAHPGVDTLWPACAGEHSDQAFEAQVRGSVGVEQPIKVGPEDAADAVAGAESFGFCPAALAGHVGGDARAVPADVGAVGGFAGKEPFFAAARAGSSGAEGGGEADPADGPVGPGYADLRGHPPASVAPVVALGPGSAAGAGSSRRQGFGL